MVIYSGKSGRWHDDYEQGRPGWPPDVAAIASVPPLATVLEIGAGTGKLTGVLASAFDHVVAVEPDAGMRRLLAARCPRARVITGRAEHIPLADASVGAVYIAEAFHPFGSDRVVNEIARVLRAAGVLVLMWNLPAGPAKPSIAAIERLLRERAPEEAAHRYDPADLSPRRYASGEWRLPFASSPFGVFREARLANPQTVHREGLLAFFASMGWIADLPDARRLPLLAEIRSLLTSEWYRRSWQTRVHWARLTPP